jgi:probable HAF family extracellular repeat protein
MEEVNIMPRIRALLFGMLLSGTNSTAFGGPGYSFTVINVPGATSTEALGINNRGDIVGGFTDGTGNHGFLYKAGAFTTIDVPGVTRGTRANGINDSGHIVGQFTDGTRTQGFLDIAGTFTTIDASGPPVVRSRMGSTVATRS